MRTENDRINTGYLWWAWVDLNHRPRPYQSSVVRFYNNLQSLGMIGNLITERPRFFPRTHSSTERWNINGTLLGLKSTRCTGTHWMLEDRALSFCSSNSLAHLSCGQAAEFFSANTAGELCEPSRKVKGVLRLKRTIPVRGLSCRAGAHSELLPSPPS